MITAKNYSLLKHNTFGIDVKADFFIEYDTVEQLHAILSSDMVRNNRMLHIGAGSNLLFTGDFHGVVLHSAIRFCDVSESEGDEVIVRVGAGVVWDDFCGWMADRGLWGIENLSHIPGEVGASAVQNIGAYGVEACDAIHSVEALDVMTGEERIFTDYGYRHSIFKTDLKDRYIVTAVSYKLTKSPRPRLEYAGLNALFSENEELTPMKIRTAIIGVRRDKLPEPSEIGSAGSFFKNPVIDSQKFNELHALYPSMPHYVLPNGEFKIPAAWFIDQCGLKGVEHGRAGVYAKQPLVLVNLGGASPDDITGLARMVQNSVRERFGVDIYPEVNYI